MSVPLIATYRLQLREGVGFDDARAMLPYLVKLGISHLYLSPIFKARSGSTHGYDCVDPRVIDPELGGEEGFGRLSTALADHGMGLLLDIVPNHLGIGRENPFWQALLRDGPESEAAAYFDIDWHAEAGGVPGKILLPFLGRPLTEVIESGELEIVGDPYPALRYHEHLFPLAAGTDEGSLEEVLERQHWRLAWWRCGNSMLNWRRFFDITELAGVRVENDAVFDETHKTLLQLLSEGRIQGLRIDHVDGLADPLGYFERLAHEWAAATKQPRWILVEKILGEDEDLPDSWPVDGTTGYEALNAILGLFIDPVGLNRLDQTYRAFNGDPDGFRKTLEAAKRQILTESLKAEFDRLIRRMLKQQDADIPKGEIEAAVTEVIIHFDYYRTYGARDRFSEVDRQRLDRAFGEAMNALPSDPAVFDFLKRQLQPPSPLLQAFEQLTGPAMAKAMEDTAFYRWFRLVALNEVGGEPDQGAVSPRKLHAFLTHRASRWPHALIATATHDTKRGEDTRLRIATLSHLAEQWDREAREWARMTERYRTDCIPKPETAYFIFQTLIGIWPIGDEGRAGIEPRLCAYLQKAMREAKSETSWLAPNERYEAALEAFVKQCLEDGAFLDRLEAFCKIVSPVAAAMSLGQTLIKLTCPGLPDIYRGTERFDQSLVDPDNRRSLDLETLVQIPENAPIDWHDGSLKQFLIARTLAARRILPELFSKGGYTPLMVDTHRPDDFFAFLREHENTAAITLVRQRGATLDDSTFPAGRIRLPKRLDRKQWRDVIWQHEVETSADINLESLGAPATLLVAD